MRESLAILCHEQWSGWMDYMFRKGEFNSDGTWTMPKWAVDRWCRQLNTHYAELSESERESDRKEADKILNIVRPRCTCDRCTGLDTEKYYEDNS